MIDPTLCSDERSTDDADDDAHVRDGAQAKRFTQRSSFHLEKARDEATEIRGGIPKRKRRAREIRDGRRDERHDARTKAEGRREGGNTTRRRLVSIRREVRRRSIRLRIPSIVAEGEGIARRKRSKRLLERRTAPPREHHRGVRRRDIATTTHTVEEAEETGVDGYRDRDRGRSPSRAQAFALSRETTIAAAGSRRLRCRARSQTSGPWRSIGIARTAVRLISLEERRFQCFSEDDAGKLRRETSRDAPPGARSVKPRGRLSQKHPVRCDGGGDSEQGRHRLG